MVFKHPYHLVDVSPWPLFVSMSIMGVLSSFLSFLFYFTNSSYFILLNTSCLCCYICFWWLDVRSEASYEGQHTKMVQIMLRMGMVLFMVSEVLLFSSFFWTYFWSALAPNTSMGSIWPPMGLPLLNIYLMPLLNTLLLLTSGLSITWSHHMLLVSDMFSTVIGLCFTLGLATIFMLLQCLEYNSTHFSMSDSVYGSIFFMTTGFHGFHVLVGTIFILISVLRINSYNYTQQHHFGFEASIWYWHLVDVIWLFLFTFVYWWGF